MAKCSMLNTSAGPGALRSRSVYPTQRVGRRIHDPDDALEVHRYANWFNVPGRCLSVRIARREREGVVRVADTEGKRSGMHFYRLDGEA